MSAAGGKGLNPQIPDSRHRETEAGGGAVANPSRKRDIIEILMAGMGAEGFDELSAREESLSQGWIALMVGTMVQEGVSPDVAVASAKGNAEILRYIEGNGLEVHAKGAASWHVEPRLNPKGLPVWWGNVKRGAELGGVVIGKDAVNPRLILDPTEGALVYADLFATWGKATDDEGGAGRTFDPYIMGYREFCDALLEGGVLSQEGHDALLEVVGQEPETHLVASIIPSTSDMNHSLTGSKGLCVALPEWAAGQESVPVTPRAGSKSKESWQMRAGTEEARAYLTDAKGDGLFLQAVASVVEGIRHDPESKDCAAVGNGMVWITSNALLNLLADKTSDVKKVIKRNDRKADLKKVEAAMMLLSTVRVNGYYPDGSPMDSVPYLVAQRREVVICNGQPYRDVWGISIGVPTVFDTVAGNMRQVHSYPRRPREVYGDNHRLMDSRDISADVMVKNILSQARGELYPSGKGGKKTSTVQRSWDSIFEELTPLGTVAGKKLTSRQKLNIRKSVENALNDAKAEARDDAKSGGKPVYISAWTTTKSGKGGGVRGKGGYGNLVVKASKTYFKGCDEPVDLGF